MANVIKKLFDQKGVNGRVQYLCTFDSVGALIVDANSAGSVDAAAGVSDSTGSDQELAIERIRWVNESGQDVALTFNPTHPIMVLYGSGHWYNDLQIKPTHYEDPYTGDGDITLTASAAAGATVIIDLRKVRGYTGRSDQGN